MGIDSATPPPVSGFLFGSDIANRAEEKYGRRRLETLDIVAYKREIRRRFGPSRSIISQGREGSKIVPRGCLMCALRKRQLYLAERQFILVRKDRLDYGADNERM